MQREAGAAWPRLLDADWTDGFWIYRFIGQWSLLNAAVCQRLADGSRGSPCYTTERQQPRSRLRVRRFTSPCMIHPILLNESAYPLHIVGLADFLYVVLLSAIWHYINNKLLLWWRDSQRNKLNWLINYFFKQGSHHLWSSQMWIFAGYCWLIGLSNSEHCSHKTTNLNNSLWQLGNCTGHFSVFYL